MPIYEYQCEKCGEFEITQRITEPPLKKCPTCKRKVRKLISNTSFQLKGSGWYVTDYARKGKDGGTGGESKSSGGESKASSSESKASSAADSKSSSSESKTASSDSASSSGGESKSKSSKKDSTAKAA
jgi:putative FmdB family regulatory protein